MRLDQNSVDASQYHGARSVQDCLDHCGSLSNCVAADVDLSQDPPTCWPHLSVDDLLPRNVYSQPGTNQYRLRNRCAGPVTGCFCIFLMNLLNRLQISEILYAFNNVTLSAIMSSKCEECTVIIFHFSCIYNSLLQVATEKTNIVDVSIRLANEIALVCF